MKSRPVVRETFTVQTRVPIELHRRARDKVLGYGIPLSNFIRMALEQFVERPIEESARMLQEHNAVMARKARLRAKRVIARKK